jgi:hypothetical protein
MRRPILYLAGLLGLGLGALVLPVAAADTSAQGYENRIKTFDPEAVAAAQSYAKTFGYKSQLEKAVPVLREEIAKQVRVKNQTLDDAEVNAFLTAFLVDDSELIENMSLVITLETFTRDELVALDRFYSSAEGRSILTKTPQLLGRIAEVMTAMQTQMLPRALEIARSQMKQKGVDVRI